MVYNNIMKLNEVNVVVSDVLTQNEIEEIYSSVNLSNRALLVKIHAQNVYDFALSPGIASKIIDYCEQLSGVNGLEIAEYQFARYENTKDDEATLKPKLTIHSDNFKEPRFTFDYQIGGNTTWPLVVDGKAFELQNNEALSFSGTHQVHWRSPKVFEEGEYVDMVFFHLRKIGADEMTDSDKAIVEQSLRKFLGQYEDEING